MASVSGGAQRTILITGVSRGLGRALAIEIAKRGHCVIGCGRSQDSLNSLQNLLPDSPDNSHILHNVDVVIFCVCDYSRVFFVFIEVLFDSFRVLIICEWN